jgi:hypothetical protein
MRTLSHLTQNEKLVRFFFLVGGELTSAQARSRYGIMNLRARINELRDAGINISTDMRWNKDQKQTVAYYSMPAV